MQPASTSLIILAPVHWNSLVRTQQASYVQTYRIPHLSIAHANPVEYTPIEKCWFTLIHYLCLLEVSEAHAGGITIIWYQDITFLAILSFSLTSQPKSTHDPSGLVASVLHATQSNQEVANLFCTWQIRRTLAIPVCQCASQNVIHLIVWASAPWSSRQLLSCHS